MTWAAISINEISLRITKGTTPTTLGEAFTDQGVRFIKAEALNGDSNLNPNGFAFIDEKTHELLKRSILQAEDVLITIAGAKTGKCGFVREEHLPANTNQAVAIVRLDNQKAVPRFVYYLFKRKEMFSFIQSLSAQAAQPNLNLTRLGQIRISLPPCDQQREIASILFAYDDLIENNRRRMQLLEQAARLLYQEWFVRLRFPGHEHVKIKDGVPEGWDRVPLSQMCTDIRQQVDPTRVAPDTPYIGLEHIPRRSITLREWGSASDVESSKFMFAAGDILFGKIRPYFHKVVFALTDGIASSDAIVIRPNENWLYEYALFLISSDEFVALASKTVREGSKMPRADWKFLLSYSFLCPPQEIAFAFSETTSSIVSQLRVLALQNRQLAKARDLLLPRLMNGELAV